ncbi:MAG: efflux RND transporter periplasmic adaptor subunit [Bryobacterales bacterium]
MTSNRVQREAQLERERAKVPSSRKPFASSGTAPKPSTTRRSSTCVRPRSCRRSRPRSCATPRNKRKPSGSSWSVSSSYNRTFSSAVCGSKRSTFKTPSSATSATPETWSARAARAGQRVGRPRAHVQRRGTIPTGFAWRPGLPRTTFLQVVDLSSLHVAASVNQVDAGAVRVGQPATVHFDAYPGIEVQGRVSSVGAIAGSSEGFGSRNAGLYVKTIPAEVAFQTKDPRVIPDLSAAVDIQLEKRDDQLLAPLSAIQRSAAEPFVFVREGKSWAQRPVELGETNEVDAVVVSGLEPGDEVALEKPAQP